jgi:hypothetical protein
MTFLLLYGKKKNLMGGFNGELVKKRHFFLHGEISSIFTFEQIETGLLQLRLWTSRPTEQKVGKMSQTSFETPFLEHTFSNSGEIDDFALFFSFFRLKIFKPLQIEKTQRFYAALVIGFILIYWLVLNFFGSPQSRGLHKYENTYFRPKSPFFPTFPTSGRMLLCDVMWCIYDVIWCYMMLYNII